MKTQNQTIVKFKGSAAELIKAVKIAKKEARKQVEGTNMLPSLPVVDLIGRRFVKVTNKYVTADIVDFTQVTDPNVYEGTITYGAITSEDTISANADIVDITSFTYRGVEVVTIVKNERNPFVGKDGCTYYTYDIKIKYNPESGVDNRYYSSIVGKVENLKHVAESLENAIKNARTSSETLLDDIWAYQDKKFAPSN